MLRSIKEIYNYVLQAEDGEIGRCKDFLFDDEHWTVRYMVVDTGKWLLGKKSAYIPHFIRGTRLGFRAFSGPVDQRTD